MNMQDHGRVLEELGHPVLGLPGDSAGRFPTVSHAVGTSTRGGRAVAVSLVDASLAAEGEGAPA